MPWHGTVALFYTVSTLNEAHQMLNEQPIEID